MTELDVTSRWDLTDLDVDPDEIDSIANTMDTVLARVVATFDVAQVDLPSRRYIWFGPTVVDCEQVTVSLLQHYLGSPGDEASAPQPCHGPRSIVLSVQVVRCTPTMTKTGAAPRATDMATYARSRARDTYILMEAGLKTCDVWGVGAIADVSPGAVQGGYQSIILNLTVPMV